MDNLLIILSTYYINVRIVDKVFTLATIDTPVYQLDALKERKRERERERERRGREGGREGEGVRVSAYNRRKGKGGKRK